MSFFSLNDPRAWLAAGISCAVLTMFGKSAFSSSKLRISRTAKKGIQIGPHTLFDDDRLRHSHILGATGSGKSVLIEQMLFQDLARGLGAIIIDAKGDRTFFEAIQNYCRKIGRESDLKYLSAANEIDSVRWNPCRLGSHSELQSKFFAAGKYEHAHYGKAAELLYSNVFRDLLERLPDGFDLSDVVKAVKVATLDGKDESTKGVYFDLINLAQLEWGGVLGFKAKCGNQEELDLLSLTRNRKILFVDLPTEGKLVQSARVGSLLLQEISLLSGMRKRSPHLKMSEPFSVYVDEFDAFATEAFVSFLNKGRSSGFMIHLAHQTLSDLRKISPTFEGQITGNVNVRFVFRTDLAEDAEKISRSFGTKVARKMTYQVDGNEYSGRGSLREVQEFCVHPDLLKSLNTGECVISVKSRSILSKIKIPMRDWADVLSKKTPKIRAALVSTERTSGQSDGKTNVIQKFLKKESPAPRAE